MSQKTPILLLKTKSTPSDAYDEYFTKNYNPLFIPVLSHQFHTRNLAHIRDLFNAGALRHDNPERKYGGLIFTSQRAVEGFARMIEEDVDGTFPLPSPLTIWIWSALQDTNDLVDDE